MDICDGSFYFDISPISCCICECHNSERMIDSIEYILGYYDISTYYDDRPLSIKVTVYNGMDSLIDNIVNIIVGIIW